MMLMIMMVEKGTKLLVRNLLAVRALPMTGLARDLLRTCRWQLEMHPNLASPPLYEFYLRVADEPVDTQLYMTIASSCEEAYAPLRADLTRTKTNMIRASIHISALTLAEEHERRGDWEGAAKIYKVAQEHCTAIMQSIGTGTRRMLCHLLAGATIKELEPSWEHIYREAGFTLKRQGNKDLTCKLSSDQVSHANNMSTFTPPPALASTSAQASVSAPAPASTPASISTLSPQSHPIPTSHSPQSDTSVASCGCTPPFRSAPQDILTRLLIICTAMGNYAEALECLAFLKMDHSPAQWASSSDLALYGLLCVVASDEYAAGALGMSVFRKVNNGGTVGDGTSKSTNSGEESESWTKCFVFACPPLRHLAQSLIEGKPGPLLSALQEGGLLARWISIDPYICSIKEQLVQRIVQNLLVDHLSAYSHIYLSTLSQHMHIPLEGGKLADLVDHLYSQGRIPLELDRSQEILHPSSKHPFVSLTRELIQEACHKHNPNVTDEVIKYCLERLMSIY